MAHMNEITAREAKNRFGQLLDDAQRAPVRISRNGRAVTVMLSTQLYDRLRGSAWERLTATMDAMGEEASAGGLTDAKLEALLADES
jgi:prevent-host-death family protein